MKRSIRFPDPGVIGNPTRGLVSPAQFIPLAEETGLILPIGSWALNTVCARIKLWQEQGRYSVMPPFFAIGVIA